jgi:hypothetical protein
MVHQYKDICKEYDCKVKVYTQSKCNLEDSLGNPDLIILFTNPVSHEMAQITRRSAARRDITLVQSHCGSGSALRAILRGVV